MKDAFNNELSIGDLVGYARNPYSDINKGIIVGFTEKKIRIGQYLEDDKSPTLCFSYQVLKAFNQDKLTEFQVYQKLTDIPEKYQNLDLDSFFEELNYDMSFMEWFFPKYHTFNQNGKSN